MDSCNRRVCSRCSKRRAARVQRRYARAVAAFRYPALVTLTVLNAATPEDLGRALGRLLGGFRELRRRKVWPAARGLWSLEVTWSPERGFHPHLHVVCDFGWVESLEGLSAEWERLVGARHRPDVKRALTAGARAGLLREGIKYVTKPWELPEEALLAVASALAGRRMVQPFGGVRAHDEERARLCCPGCAEPYSSRSYDQDWIRDWVPVEDLQRIATGPRWADWKREGWRRGGASHLDHLWNLPSARGGGEVAFR